MSFLKKLFGGGVPKDASGKSEATPKGANPVNEPDMIRAYDSYGREVYITKKEWRDKVLLGNIEQRWNDADQLYQLIFQALNDGFAEDMVRPARRLVELTPDAEHSAVMLAVVYLQLKQWDEAEKALSHYIQGHGETGLVLTNLAKVHAGRAHHALADEVLWRALELDPNQQNGVEWYLSLEHERSGEEGSRQALSRLAAISTSWRAQLWLARMELQAGHLQAALDLYQTSLNRAGPSIPPDLLMQMSGDLGTAGHLAEIVRLVGPQFDPLAHGLQVGNNLIKAHLDLGQWDEAQKVLVQLYAQKRPDWTQALSYWDTEIAKTRVAVSNLQPGASPQTELTCCEGPVWLDVKSPAGSLFGFDPNREELVSFLGSSAEIAALPDRAVHQLSDAAGRLSRALPLFLAEQVGLRAGMAVQTLVPWISHPVSSLAFVGFAWADEDAIRYALQSGEHKSKYVVITHLLTQAEPWTLRLRLLRASDGHCLLECSETCPMAHPMQAVVGLSAQLLGALGRAEGLQMRETPAAYVLPMQDEHFSFYLLRLEQLLAVRLGAMEETSPQFLSGEREIVAGNLQQCLVYPSGVNVRLLLARTLLAMKKANPQVLTEFRERIELLQKDKPLAQPAHEIVQALIDKALAG